MRTLLEYKYNSRRINLVLGSILIWNVYCLRKSYFYQILLSLAHTYIHRQNKTAPKFQWIGKFFFFKLKISLFLKGSIHLLKDFFQEMNSFFNNILIFCNLPRNFIPYLIREQISKNSLTFSLKVVYSNIFLVIYLLHYLHPPPLQLTILIKIPN